MSTDYPATSATTTDSLLDRVRGELQRWLTRKRWTREEFTGFLLGYSLPPLGYDSAPHQWIADAIVDHESASPGSTLRATLADRIAKYLSYSWRAATDPLERDELLDGLFNLCVFAADPEKLAAPLLAFYRKLVDRRVKPRASFALALAEALSSNQTGDDLRELWGDLIAGKQSPLIGGNPQIAFEGLCRIPRVDINALIAAFGRLRDHPYINDDLAASSLTTLVMAIDRRQDSVAKKRKWIQRANTLARSRHTGGPELWDELIIRRADREIWPIWAVQSLERLCVRVSSSDDASPRWLLWCSILPFLQASGKFVDPKTMCQGEVLEVEAAVNWRQFEQLIHAIEQARLDNPYESKAAQLGVLLTAVYSVTPPSLESMSEMSTKEQQVLPNSIMKVAARLRGLEPTANASEVPKIALQVVATASELDQSGNSDLEDGSAFNRQYVDAVIAS